MAYGLLSPGGDLSTRAPPGGGPGPFSPLFSVPPPTPSSGPLLPPLFRSPALSPAPAAGPQALGSGQCPAFWGAVGSALCCPLWTRSLAGPAALPLGSASALGCSPVGTHSPARGPARDPRRLQRPVQEPSLPWGPLPSLLLTSDPPSVLAGPHACPVPASRVPGHAPPSPPVHSLSCSSTARQPPELPSSGQQCSWCCAPFLGSVPALVRHCDRGQLPPSARLAAPAPLGILRPVSLQGSHSCLCVLILGVPTHPWWGLWRGLPCSLGLWAPSLLWPQTHVAPGICALCLQPCSLALGHQSPDV